MYRYKIVFSYDGTLFSGYAKQSNLRTIQGEVERVLQIVFREEILIYASGRTDKKVHALNQVADFLLSKKINNIDFILYRINKNLPKDIYVKSLKRVKLSFSSRLDAKEKIYQYRLNIKEYDPLMRNYEAFDLNVKDIDYFIELSKIFIGTHCFKNFTSKKEDDRDFIRTIFDISIKLKKNVLFITFKGNGFMRYEVRKIVQTLIEGSKRKISKERIIELLNSPNREIINVTADPSGLYLVKVRY